MVAKYFVNIFYETTNVKRNSVNLVHRFGYFFHLYMWTCYICPYYKLLSIFTPSISLEDSYSICLSIPTKNPALSPAVPHAPYSPLSTFHPPGQGRTSPEGSSFGEQEREGVQNEEESEDKYDEDNNIASREEKEYLYAKVSHLF